MMNDAYTIGITLALENGVSAGVEEIRRDLEQLNHAVDTSIGQLARLSSQWGAVLHALRQPTQDFGLTQMAEAGRQLAMRGSAAGLPRKSLQRSESEYIAETAPSAANAVPTEGKETPALSPVAARQESMPLIKNSVAEKPSLKPTTGSDPALASSRFAISVNVPRSWNEAGADLKSYAVPSLAAVPPNSESTPSLANIAVTQSPWPSAAPVIPARILQASDLAALMRESVPIPGVISSAVGTVPLMHAEPQPASSAATSSTVTLWRPSAPRQEDGGVSVEKAYPQLPSAVPFPPLSTTNRHDVVGEARIGFADFPRDSTAPVIASRVLSRTRTVNSPLTDTGIPEPLAQNQTAGSEMGHVFLDGQLVGRWMREHLTQMAGRPPSGSTSFDPKLGMVWPGAPIQV